VREITNGTYMKMVRGLKEIACEVMNDAAPDGMI
jgi:hypothetical protein